MIDLIHMICSLSPYSVTCNAQGLFIKTHKDFATEILTSLHAKNFSLTSLDLRTFMDCDINEPELTNFFEKHCSSLKLLALDKCWDTNVNSKSGPFFTMVSRIGFNVSPFHSNGFCQ